MRDVAAFATRRPYDEEQYVVHHSDALKARFAIGFARVLAGQQITMKEIFKVSEVDAVIGKVLFALSLIPSVHVRIVYAIAYADKWRFCLLMLAGEGLSESGVSTE
jgi:hypothetical protein